MPNQALSSPPLGFITDHCVEDGEEFSHAGCDGDFLLFSFFAQARVEVFEDWIPSDGA